jgi:hypothetical protein
MEFIKPSDDVNIQRKTITFTRNGYPRTYIMREENHVNHSDKSTKKDLGFHEVVVKIQNDYVVNNYYSFNNITHDIYDNHLLLVLQQDQGGSYSGHRSPQIIKFYNTSRELKGLKIFFDIYFFSVFSTLFIFIFLIHKKFLWFSFPKICTSFGRIYLCLVYCNNLNDNCKSENYYTINSTNIFSGISRP